MNEDRERDAYKDRVESDRPHLMICLPLGNCPCGEKHIERECFVCHGRVGINPTTFGGKGIPGDLWAVCGSCALDILDNEGPKEHLFTLTDYQKTDPGAAIARARQHIGEMSADGWGRKVMEHVRRHRKQYDARPSVPLKGAN